MTNHDMNRVMSEFINNQELAKNAATILLTIPGTPFIYYGEEIGLTGIRYENDDISRRDALLWDINSPFNTSWQPPAKMPRGQNSLTSSVFEQNEDETSLLNHYRNLSALRSKYRAIREGDFSKVIWAGYNTSELISYFRSTKTNNSDDETLIVIHNTGVRILELQSPQDTDLVLVWSSMKGFVNSPEKQHTIVISPGESMICSVK